MDLLIVDDEDSLREMLTVLFEGEGYHVDSAASICFFRMDQVSISFTTSRLRTRRFRSS
jgi:DNA-binding response OmpR family regulator